MIEQQILIEEVNANEINDALQLIVDRENIFPSNTGDTIINSSKRDKELMNILLSCERYVLKQRELDQELSSGFYRLAQSRRNRGSHVYSVDDVRFEIEPELCLHADGENGQVLGNYESGEELPEGRRLGC